MPLVIEVQDDEVVSMEFQNGKAIRPEDRTFFESNATIDRIFASLENTLGDRPDYFSAEYHEIYGFPAQVRVDYDRSITDDEHTLIVSNFEVLP
jgi:hypothetical protein